MTKLHVTEFWRNGFIVIDDYVSNFAELHFKSLNLIDKVSDHNRSEIEKNKQTSNVPRNVLENNVLEKLTRGVNNFELYQIFNRRYLKPLALFDNQPFQFFHSSFRGAVLGAHVDHSYLPGHEDFIHVANAIYYAHSVWKPEWGGETLLFDKTGKTVLHKIEPRPNRLLLFLHTSESFHGMAESRTDTERRTIYMDYYLSKLNVSSLVGKWWYHGTTFVPPKFGSPKWAFYAKAWAQYKFNKTMKAL